MRKSSFISTSLMLFALASIGSSSMQAQRGEPVESVPARMTVTLRVQGSNKKVPDVNRDDVLVKQGKTNLQVTRWTPAVGASSGLDLFILLDDASDPILGSQFDDLRAFIIAQPKSSSVGLGYMQNATVQIVQDFTTDHAAAAGALRLPLPSSGIYGSPYLSLIDLLSRWPKDGNRREVVMITDGIDRFRGDSHYNGLSFISPDVDSASRAAQRTGTVIDTIFTRGVGRRARNYWEITNGQNAIAKLSDETGGESYYLGAQNPVSFSPYLDDVQKALGNQYLLEFRAVPGKRSGLQYINLKSSIAGVELDSADSVWVPGR